LFSKAFDYAMGKVEPEDVYNDIMSGRQTLWVVFDDATEKMIGSFTIRVKEYKSHSALCGEHLGGERLDEWADNLFEIMESYARDLGIHKLELMGRRGWERTLRPKGWKPTLAIFEKEI
jgi:hypothetical protein